jgi:hypothetical protein
VCCWGSSHPVSSRDSSAVPERKAAAVAENDVIAGALQRGEEVGGCCGQVQCCAALLWMALAANVHGPIVNCGDID